MISTYLLLEIRFDLIVNFLTKNTPIFSDFFISMDVCRHDRKETIARSYCGRLCLYEITIQTMWAQGSHWI